jgi:hypothetical protein
MIKKILLYGINTFSDWYFLTQCKKYIVLGFLETQKSTDKHLDKNVYSLTDIEKITYDEIHIANSHHETILNLKQYTEPQKIVIPFFLEDNSYINSDYDEIKSLCSVPERSLINYIKNNGGKNDLSFRFIPIKRQKSNIFKEVKKKIFDEYTKYISENLKFIYEKPKIDFLVFWVGTKCTLRCKRCCNLIPYVSHKSYDSNELIEDLDFLLSIVDIKSLQVQGGEPFTHPDLAKLLSYLVNKTKCNFYIATNGTIKTTEQVLSIIQKSNVPIRISNYKIDKIKRNLEDQLKKHSIDSFQYDFMYGNGSWFDSGGPLETDDSMATAKLSYEKCPDKVCNTVANGILYVCGKIPSLREIHGSYNRKKKESSSIEVNIRSIRKNKILKILHLNIIVGRLFMFRFQKSLKFFRPECGYCRISSNLYPAGEQLTTDELNYIKNKIKENL